MKTAVKVAAPLAVAVFAFFAFENHDANTVAHDSCPQIQVEFAKLSYTDPIPYFDDNGELINFGPRELGSQLSVECYPGFSMNGYLNKITCEKGGRWSTHERPSCVLYWSKMQIFVFCSFAFISVTVVLSLWRSCSNWKRHEMSAQRGSIFKHKELIRVDGELSEHEMGNHSAIVLSLETITLFAGFAAHFLQFLRDGIWYLNPSEKTMVNPGQSYVSNHVFLGFSICLAMMVMAGLITFEQKTVPRGPFRRTHKFLGEFVIPAVAIAFLASAVWAELQLPGNVSQKIARNMLTLWVAMVLFFLIKHAWNKNIKAHLHYVVCFWGLVCSAGALRGMVLLWGYLLGCENGYAANPTLGIVTGTLFSTLFPMIWFVHLNGTWNQPYARWCIFFASYYQLLLPLYFKHLARPCYPRMNMATVYPNYKFPMPREFYDNEESYIEAFMHFAGGM